MPTVLSVIPSTTEHVHYKYHIHNRISQNAFNTFLNPL